MTPTDFGKLIKSGLSGIFIFYGDELYLKNHYMKLAKNSCTPDGANVINVPGDNLTLSDVLRTVMDTACMPSMDMDKRFINIYNIEWSKVKEDDLHFLEDCANELSDYDDVVVVIDTLPDTFDAGTDKKPSALLKKITSSVKPVHFAKEPPARLAAWVQKHFAANKVIASSFVCHQLVNRSARDMAMLSNEIEKLCAYVLWDGRNEVTEIDIQKVSSFSVEINTFDFLNALLDGNYERAFLILNDMKLHKERPDVILGSIVKNFTELYSVKLLLESGYMLPDIASKMNMPEFRTKNCIQRAKVLSKAGLEKAVSLCHEADLKIKSTNFDSYNVLEILLIKLSMTGRLK